ncbi:MAG: hypothetical protein ABIP29_12075, partial [Candidatus Eisenbacteria bacterium]
MLLVTLALVAVLLAFYPLYALVTGGPIRLRPDAPGLVPGLFACPSPRSIRRCSSARTWRSRRRRSCSRWPISLPRAVLFEAGAGTIWAPALVHFIVQGSIKLVDVPAEAMMPMAVAWMAVCATVPYLVFLRRVLPMHRLPVAALATVLLFAG